MSLLLLVPMALAASQNLDPAVAAVMACPEEAACPAADALYDRVFVDGAGFPPGPLWLEAVARAEQAGLARLAGGVDRAAVDPEVGAALGVVDRGVGPEAETIEQLVFSSFGRALLDAYAALPGEAGPHVAQALARPPRDRQAVLTAVDGGCRRSLEADHLAVHGQPLTRPAGGVGWILSGWRSGELRARAATAMDWGLVDSWCSAPTVALGADPHLPGPRTPLERALVAAMDVTAFVVLAGDVVSDSAVHLTSDYADEILAYERRRAALRP